MKRCGWCGYAYFAYKKFPYCPLCWVLDGVKRPKLLRSKIAMLRIAIFTLGIMLISQNVCNGSEKAKTGMASYYTVASCKREKTSGIMANGQPLNDTALTVASWDYPFGTKLEVCNQHYKCVIVAVTDRGPAKRLYRQGRIIDLSKTAFEKLAPLSVGVIQVNIKKLS